MGILSSSVSITQYRVEGKLPEPILETVANGLKKHAIEEIDNESSDKAIGWTSFNDPFNVDFDQSPFLIGTYLVFSMRIDKKTIPSKIVKIEDNVATIDVDGVRREASLLLVENPKIGDYVIVHAGFAINKLNEEDAQESLKLLKEAASLTFENPKEGTDSD